jgi:type II secretory ATPase GspE/PulE/Tfp pilus assembly ATPase PilB-like protein
MADLRAVNMTSFPTPSPLSDLLVQRGLVTPAKMAEALAESSIASIGLGDYLVARDAISLGDLLDARSSLGHTTEIASTRNLPEWDVVLNDVGQLLGGTERPVGTLVLAVGSEIANGDRRVFILTTSAEKQRHRYASIFAKITAEGYRIRAILVASEASILDVVMSEWTTHRSGTAGKDGVQASAMHKKWDTIVHDAHKAGASDIHLRAALGKGELKFRINGELEHQQMSLTEEDATLLASSMYNTMVDQGSTGDGFNPRLIQDAVITRALPDGALRLRYSGIPVEPSGINVTLRLIPVGATAKPKSPSDLGYSADQCETLDRIFSRSSGLILFLGTTGSGKSTSMANMLMKMMKDRPGKMLRTVEEPVEIRIPGSNVSQTSVVRGKRDDEGTNAFVDVMRGLMRADPDYLMVGEIRDRDTANLAVQAVRSGHLCVSTLHADGAPVAYDRLAGMGIPRGDIASVGLIAGLIYQRLVRTLCPHCKVPAERAIKDSRNHAIGLRLNHYLAGQSNEGIFFQSDVGCPHCHRRGVTGRTVCAEILVPRPNMLRAIAEGDSRAIWLAWREAIDETRPERMNGRTSFEHALWKMKEGICSPDDVEKEFRFLDEPAFE